MNEIKCPNCGKVFQIDESDYESIVRQIRNSEFEKELSSREIQYTKEKESAIKLATAHLKEELNNSLNKKDLEIVDLKNKLELAKSQSELEVQKAVAAADKKISELEIRGKETKETYENKLKDKDEQIAYYKDFKARQSTKMIGESLEVHCFNEFNKLRPLFPNSYFEKDNDAKSGSKGDFIFRDYDDDKNEIVSIMFEMKNEADETSTKHKNEDFLKELDKDRKEKNCEYAVLVSLLEVDNEYYNEGIVDVSHLYPKMYVIRPQFFIPLITLIRNLANKSLEYRKELELVRNQNIDITHFEDNINAFKEGFSKNFNSAKKNFDSAIDEIDKAIKRLEAVKAALTTSENQLRLANSKAEDLTITKLTRNNPTMKEMFDNLNDEK